MRIARVAVDDHRFDELDAVAEAVEDVEVRVDDRVEDRVQQKSRAFDLRFAKALLDLLQRGERALVDRDDRVVLEEDAELNLGYDVGTLLLEPVHDDEVMVVVLVDLRALVPVLRVLDRERVEVKLRRRELELLALRIGDVEPAGMLAAHLRQLIRRLRGDRMRLFDEKARRHEARIRARSGREATDDAHQLARIERLRKIRLGVAAIGLVPRIARAGEDHERDVTQRHAQLARERRSVDARHLHVEDDEGGRVMLHDPQRLGAIARLDDTEAVVVENLALGAARGVVVIDDEHGTRFRLSRHDRGKARVVPDRQSHARLYLIGNSRRYEG